MSAARTPVTLTHAPVKGALLLITGEAMLAIMAALIKHASSELPPEMVVFFRNLFGLLTLFPILMVSGGFRQIRTRRIGMHLLRSLSGVTAMFGFFYIIAHIPLAEAALVKLTSPFFLPIIAWLWLSERISRHTAFAILVGFIGVIFILKPGTASFTPVALIGLGAAALASFAKVCIRKMADTEAPGSVVFWFGLFSTLISAVPLFWVGSWPAASHWPWLFAIGLCGTLGQIAMTRAYQVASPGRIGPYTYTSVIFATGFGWYFWGELLHWATVVGSLLIISAGIYNLRAKS